MRQDHLVRRLPAAVDQRRSEEDNTLLGRSADDPYRARTDNLLRKAPTPGRREVIGEEDRRLLGDLAMRAIDSIVEGYGEDATLEDAVLIYEVALPNEDGLRITE